MQELAKTLGTLKHNTNKQTTQKKTANTQTEKVHRYLGKMQNVKPTLSTHLSAHLFHDVVPIDEELLHLPVNG